MPMEILVPIQLIRDSTFDLSALVAAGLQAALDNQIERHGLAEDPDLPVIVDRE